MRAFASTSPFSRSPPHRPRAVDRGPLAQPRREAHHPDRPVRRRPMRDDRLGFSERPSRNRARARAKLVGPPLLTGLQRRTRRAWQGKLFIPDKNMRVAAKMQLRRRAAAQGLRLRRRQDPVQGADLDPHRRDVARSGWRAAVHGGKLSAPFPPQIQAKAMNETVFPELCACRARRCRLRRPPGATSKGAGRTARGDRHRAVRRRLCGTVVKASASSRPRRGAAAAPALIGARVIDGIRPAGDGVFRRRRLRRRAATSAPAARSSRSAPTALNVRGCVLGVFCKTTHWDRISR